MNVWKGGEIMKEKIIRGAIAAAMTFAALAGPALAINDSQVPANECAPGNSSAVGNPKHFNGTNPGIDTHSDPVGRPASANNPGQSTGAQGQANSQASTHCNP